MNKMAVIIKKNLIIAVAIMLVSIPVSSAESGIVSENSNTGFDGVKLWSYNVDIRSNYDYFWTSMNPSKYIMPENPIIRYYANNTDEIQIDYSPDNGDYWQNPDYTLKIMKGDCEDEAFVWVSIHRAKGHKAIVVGGYLFFDDGTSIRDIWYEYVDNNIHQIKFVTPVVSARKFYKVPMFMFSDKMGIRDYDPNWMTK
jgi:hypothetical protein